MRLNRSVLWLAWFVGGGITVVHVLRPTRFALYAPDSAAVLETAAACGALLLAAMTFGRWRQRLLVSDLLTAYAFSILAAGNLLFALLPIVVGSDTTRPGLRIAALLSGALAGLLLATASICGDRPVSRRPRLDLPLLLILVVFALGSLAVLGWVTRDSFPMLAGTASTEAGVDSGDGGSTVVQAAAALAFAVAALRFAQRGRRGQDAFNAWLSVALVLWAAARANYAVTPASQGSSITFGDWFRIAAYGVAVFAVAVEFHGYWQRLAGTAVLEERRRIARDMHDGLAQELAFIATQGKALATSADPARAQMVARAAERALDESRRAIAALTRPVDEPLDVALAQQAEELSGRLGVRVLLDLEPVGSVRSDTREALLRIAREAITNAGRHGRPTKISVHLSNHQGIALGIFDDGRGFRPDDPKNYAGDRWGLAGMRERAEALGGTFTLESRPYRGTRVEVWVP